ncbi:Ydc2-catalyt-domain-containing protein [Apiospora arundinis]
MTAPAALRVPAALAASTSPLNIADYALKGAQLKTLCLACGLPTSGTKDVLKSRLEEAVLSARRPKGRPTARRILSIDMGLRNLAYSLIVPSGPLLSAPSAPPLKEMHFTSSQPFRQPPRVLLEAWRRSDVASEGTTQVVEREQWAPSAMANLALELVRDRLLPTNPTHVVIERQRFRSGGSSAVQEWTLRVNTLEAMIHSTFRTLKEMGHWSGEVISVAPGRVGPFWVGAAGELDAGTKEEKSPLELEIEFLQRTEQEVNIKKKNKLAKTRNKKAKIDLVGNWLQLGGILNTASTQQELKQTMKLYLDRWRGVRKKKGSNKLEEVEGESRKLDDLADCLLQGMAFIKWEENKNLLAREGPNAILENPEQAFRTVMHYDGR